MTTTAPLDATVSVAPSPTSQLDFLRAGVRFTVAQTRAGSASCPADPWVRRQLSEQVQRRCILLARGINAAAAVVEQQRRAAGLPFASRTTRDGTYEVLPTGVCETCGEAIGWLMERTSDGEKKLYISTASIGGMCELCCLARMKNLKAEEGKR